jgi:hypothetical protein
LTADAVALEARKIGETLPAEHRVVELDEPRTGVITDAATHRVAATGSSTGPVGC